MHSLPVRLAGKPWAWTHPALSTVLAVLGLLSGCSAIPTSGPSTKEVLNTSASVGSDAIQVVPVSSTVAKRLLKGRSVNLFSEAFQDAKQDTLTIGAGDGLEVSIWEAPPAALFGGGSELRAGAAINASRQTTLPEQFVNSDGSINVPFVGLVAAQGKTPQQIEAEITARLKGKANQPQVLVRVTRAISSSVTVIGDVSNSLRVPLSARSERLLDALAAAGGTKNAISKTTVQVTRGNRVLALPLETVVRDPRQNVPLRAGDVITALFQPLSFTALGATGKNDEINYEAQGINLAQALGRIGGLQDARSDARGVFVFRYEDRGALDWPKPPIEALNNKVPVIYTVDLTDPSSFFVMQSFAIENRDLIYVSNAPLTEFQKFANAVFSIAFPLLNTISVTR